jgi:hypothetical protein
MIKKTQVAVTIDTDWASDEVIEYTLEILLEYKIKTTWLITHDSNVIRRLFCCNDIFEIGIHPNFLPNSTQGSGFLDIMSRLLSIYPKAKIMRTHSLYQSTPMFEAVLKNYPAIEIDVSLFLPYEKNITPHKFYISGDKKPYIVRIPYVWEDDMEMVLPSPEFEFNIKKFNGKGIKIFNFHPIHIALNSTNLVSYEKLKKDNPSGLLTAKLKDVFKFRQIKRAGIEDFLKNLLSNKDVQFVHIGEGIRR